MGSENLIENIIAEPAGAEASAVENEVQKENTGHLCRCETSFMSVDSRVLKEIQLPSFPLLW